MGNFVIINQTNGDRFKSIRAAAAAINADPDAFLAAAKENGIQPNVTNKITLNFAGIPWSVSYTHSQAFEAIQQRYRRSKKIARRYLADGDLDGAIAAVSQTARISLYAAALFIHYNLRRIDEMKLERTFRYCRQDRKSEAM